MQLFGSCWQQQSAPLVNYEKMHRSRGHRQLACFPNDFRVVDPISSRRSFSFCTSAAAHFFQPPPPTSLSLPALFIHYFVRFNKSRKPLLILSNPSFISLLVPQMNLIVISGQILRIRTEINKKFIDLAFFFSFFFFFDFI